jgi:hypothetical protein
LADGEHARQFTLRRGYVHRRRHAGLITISTRFVDQALNFVCKFTPALLRFTSRNLKGDRCESAIVASSMTAQ